ncbi:MAG: hypothetical protein U0S36_01340 [Candidatus Nanopelagicales bacterium]
MKRALLVSTGTVAGLAAVLSYSGGEAPAALADVPAGSVAGLGAPAPEESASPAAAAPAASAAPSKAAAPKPAASTSAKPKPAKSAAAPAPAPAQTAGKAAPAPTKAPAPKPTPKPTPTKTKPAPPPAPSGDFTGTAVTYKYGTLQMGIRVKNGKIVDAWAVKYPKGDSQPYSEMAIPILREQTIGAKSASLSGATGASLTSNAWMKSLAGAMSKAGI